MAVEKHLHSMYAIYCSTTLAVHCTPVDRRTGFCTWHRQSLQSTTRNDLNSKSHVVSKLLSKAGTFMLGAWVIAQEAQQKKPFCSHFPRSSNPRSEESLCILTLADHQIETWCPHTTKAFAMSLSLIIRSKV